jgi:zinc D-Ala-D-Ala dipeptidase
VPTRPEQADRYCGTQREDAPTSKQGRILAAALTSAGLVDFPTEWWHRSYGDRYWALTTNTDHAIYGSMRSPVAEAPVWRRS